MERSPIKDIEIKYLLKNALTDDINSREVYMKGIDNSYYEGYTTFKAEELWESHIKSLQTPDFQHLKAFSQSIFLRRDN